MKHGINHEQYIDFINHLLLERFIDSDFYDQRSSVDALTIVE